MSLYKFTKPIFSAFIAVAALLASASSQERDGEPATLKEAFAGKFLIGCAISASILQVPDHPALALAETQFNSITPTDSMKWDAWNPQPDQFNYEAADAFVDFGTERDMVLIGHPLFWHHQTPNWVFEDDEGKPATRDVLLERMRQRVRQLSKRYGDRVKIWDVVNEAIWNDGTLRQTKFLEIIGDDYIEQAFRIAAEELPDDAVLVYNDYNMFLPARRAAFLAMVKDFREKGVRLDAIGMEGHYALDYPESQQLEDSIVAFAAAGLPIHFTEFDVEVLERLPYIVDDEPIPGLQPDAENNPYADGKLPDAVQQQLADRYAELFAILLKHADKIERITFWGVGDGDSWTNFWPIPGRTSFPLLFDRDYNPKPAFFSVMEEARKASQ